ncbi:hypothetical protein SD80_011925 [Scytonema tolypothrichoides VB-61278]|nr:hypothetical protein SD80_011925 [Scytonema tolypothrichoides VB-61278]
MIIQYPDGNYECCPLPAALAHWTRFLLRRLQEVRVVIRARQTSSGACGAALCSCGDGGAS